MQYVKVNKRDLPVPLIVEGDGGERVVLSIEPACKEKLGARIGQATEAMKRWVKSVLFRGR